MKIKFFYILFFLTSFLPAQNLDSLYKALLNLKQNSFIATKGNRTAKINFNYSKCATGLIIKVQENLDKFSPAQRATIKKILTRPYLQTSVVTPSGKFRIHYDTVGVNKPGFPIDWFAGILDSVYRFEILKLGYPFPPADGTAGGDSKYDFYIENLPAGVYGMTTPDSSIGGLRYTAYCEMDNDFLASERYYSTGKDGAKVTAAHEFHHAVQIGDYINRYAQDGFYYEITSTAMEEFTFDDVNDYYYYLKTYFNHPDLTLSQNDGYDLAILNIFLQKRFDFSLLKRIWELMVNHRAIEAIALAIAERGSTFADEFNRFGTWCYFTNVRAQPTVNTFFDYDESVNYPLIVPSTTIEFKPPQKTVNLNTAPVSNMFVYFPDFTEGNNDTLVAIITNSDIESGIDNKKKYINLNYTLYSDAQKGAVKINDRYYYNVVSADENMLKVSHIFNDIPIAPGTKSEEVDFAYPQPFRYSKNNYIFVPAPFGNGDNARLSVFTASMEKVFDKELRVYSINKIVVRWNGRNDKGEKLPTGVYLFSVNRNERIKKGKLVIFND